MAEKDQACACQGGVHLIFPCSGAADVGEISDRAARKMTSEGCGKMFCLAGIGGNVGGIVASAKAADKVLVIDGCALDCAKKTMEERGIVDFFHFRVTDMGMEKSKSPVTDVRLNIVADKGKALLLGQ